MPATYAHTTLADTSARPPLQEGHGIHESKKEARRSAAPDRIAYEESAAGPVRTPLVRMDLAKLVRAHPGRGSYIPTLWTWGREALRDLVRTKGAVQGLGVDEAAFANRWFEYARARYAF